MAVGTVRMNELHMELKKTRQFTHKGIIDDILLECISTGNMSMPTVQYLAEISDEYKSDMIRLYNGTFGLYQDVSSIPDAIKVGQAAVLDGFCYFYNLVENNLGGICTLNFKPLGLDPILDAKILDKAFKMNTVGEIYSHRIDFNYNSYSSAIADFKTVAHKSIIDEEVTMLVPYSAGYALSKMVETFMNQGHILCVKQVLYDNSVKVRCISTNQKHLQNYCDSESACVGLTTEYYPLQGFLYAPVLGAPSTTAMKTRVNFFYLENIAKVSSYAKCKELGIQKCKDPIVELFLEQAILSTMGMLSISMSDEYMRVLGKLPDIGVKGSMFEGDFGTVNLANYLHTATKGIKSKMLKIIPGAQEAFEERMSVINPQVQKITVTRENIRQLLRDYVIKIVWKKANGMYSSSVCTNSNKILRKVYGNGYFGVYESFGVRIRSLVDEMEAIGMPLDLALKDYGFEPELKGKILEIQKEKNVGLEEAMYQAMGKKKRASSSNESLLTARSLASYLSSDYNEGSVVPKANDYYVSIDIDHIIRAEVVG